MKYVFAAILVASSLAGARAQQPARPDQQPVATRAAKVTISGCLQTAPPPAPSAGATPSAPVATQYELADAKVVSEVPVGTTGAVATTTRYRLEAEDKTLAPHLNHQVEVTGTVSPASATAAAAAPLLQVELLTKLASRCR
jgi:hypothetical protein